LGWYLTDKVIEPRLKRESPVDDNIEDEPKMEELNSREKTSFWIASLAMVLGLVGLFLWAYPEDSALRAPNGDIASFSAP
jgi:aminobenzoyl-glutamate transport protein